MEKAEARPQGIPVSLRTRRVLAEKARGAGKGINDFVAELLDGMFGDNQAVTMVLVVDSAELQGGRILDIRVRPETMSLAQWLFMAGAEWWKQRKEKKRRDRRDR